MTNAALLAARLSGRPLLMLPSAVEAYAHQLLALGPEPGSRGLRGWLGAARRAIGGADAAPKASGPACYYPMWLESAAGGPDGEGYGWSLKNGVALLTIDGPICAGGWAYDGETYIAGYDCLSRTFAEIGADARVKAVFIRQNSPGGVAAPGLPALTAQMRALRSEKPIWSSCELAASADYWIACSGSRVTAPGLGYVGSIGAVLTHCDMSAMLDKDGIVMTPIQFGAKKTDGVSYKPLSDSAKADLQAEIDEVGRLFVAGVMAGRPNLTEAAILATEAGCFLAEASDPARSGLQLGLIDAVLTEQEAFTELSALIARPTGALSSRSLPKETKMANPNRKGPSAAISAAALAAATAQPSAAAPDAGYMDCDTCGGTGLMADDTACADCDGEGQVPDPSQDAPEQPDGADASAEAAANALAISGSAEATSHPHLALAAIKSGQSLPQLQATIAALAAAPKASRFEGFSAPRLGPDALKGAAPKLDAAAIFAERAKTAKAG